MIITLFNNLTNKDKSTAVENLIKGSTPSQDFFFMIILSILTSTLGLILNNVAVIIGSMLIAPILYPVLSLSLGIIMADGKLISRAFYTLLKSFLFGVLASFVATFVLAGHFNEITPEILSRANASLPYLVIAIIAGFAGSFALVKPHLSEVLPGIAISVAIIPPIATIGIGLAKLDLAIIGGAFLLFLVNMVGVIFSGMLTFSMMNFYVKRSEADKAADKEDKKLEKEKEKASK